MSLPRDPGFFRPTTRKRGGRPSGSLSAQSRIIRDAVRQLQAEYRVVTVRQAFYQLTVRGVVEKSEAGYRAVQRQILLMRREGQLPWRFIADSTRYMRKVTTYDAAEDAVAEIAATYRRNLWRAQNVRLELWLEKDALAGVVEEATYKWDVPLMVSRGQASDTFCYSAAQSALDAWRHRRIKTYVFAMYDADRSGRDAAEKIREKLNDYSDGTPIEFELIAVTNAQIREWSLPTRPPKRRGDPPAVELDAIPPERLLALVESKIVALIDAEAWRREQEYERSEFDVLQRIDELLRSARGDDA